MHLVIECDEKGKAFFCKLLAEALQDKWDAERLPPPPLFEGERIFIVRQP